MVQKRTQIVAVVMAIAISGSVFGQAAAPAAPAPPTLWSFLGVPQGVKKVKGALTNRRGNRPQAEPKDALKALNDPANLESPDAAIKRAAEIKKAEDLKPQKIKAIKYLTSIGCGCYDKDGSVTDALVAAAEDCTEEVRLSTMQQIHSAATGKCCSNCGQVCCCNEKMLKKLAQIAYERDQFGCYGEPSKRVREAAATALAACCPGAVPLEILKEEPKEKEPASDKKPDPVPVPEREKEGADVVPERDEDATEEEPADEDAEKSDEESSDASEEDSDNAEDEENADSATNDIVRRPYLSGREPARLPQSAGFQPSPAKVWPFESSASDLPVDSVSLRFSDSSASTVSIPPRQSGARSEFVGQVTSVPAGIARMRQLLAANPPHNSASPNPRGGVVLAYDANSQTAYVHFERASEIVPVGTALHLRPDPQVANGFNGMWQVIESAAGCANLQPLDSEGVARVRVGDHANFGTPEVVVAPVSFAR